MSSINETAAEVLRLDAQATPGPWDDQSTPEGGDVEVLVDLDEEWAAGLPDEFAPRRWDARPICALPAREGAMRPGLPHEQRAADAALIAYYRTAAPALAREVQRLQGEVEQAQTGHDCALVAAYESGHRAGQKAMRERAAALCHERQEKHRRGRIRCGPGKKFGKLQVAEDEAFSCVSAIRTLEVE